MEYSINLTAKKMIAQERGATVVEYAIMLALIALVVIGSVAVLGNAVFDLFDSVPNPSSG